MFKLFIGIDNGATGSIGIIGEKYSDFILTPVEKRHKFTKSEGNMSFLLVKEFGHIITNAMNQNNVTAEETYIFMEKPLTMGGNIKGDAPSKSMFIFGEQLAVIEILKIGMTVVNSREWQRKYLPQGIKGSTEQKKASKDIGSRMFPNFADLITKHKDADGLFIALLCKEKMKF